MPCFIINENELEILTSVNDKAERFFSIAGFLLGTALSIGLGWAFATEPSELVTKLSALGSASCLTFAGTMVYLALQERRSRTSMIDRIKRETRPRQH